MELAKLAKTAHKTQPVFYFNSVKNNKNDNYVEVTWFAVYFPENECETITKTEK